MDNALPAEDGECPPNCIQCGEAGLFPGEPGRGGPGEPERCWGGPGDPERCWGGPGDLGRWGGPGEKAGSPVQPPPSRVAYKEGWAEEAARGGREEMEEASARERRRRASRWASCSRGGAGDRECRIQGPGRGRGGEEGPGVAGLDDDCGGAGEHL